MMNHQRFPAEHGLALPPSREDPVVARRYLLEGERLFAAGEFAAALDRYQRALELWRHPACHYNLAITAWRLGDSARATAHLSETVRLAPRHARAHEALSQRFLEDGRGDLALEHIRIAMDLAPQDRSVAVSRAFALAYTGQERAAWELIEPMLAGQQTPPRVAVLYGKIARRVDREADALALILTLLENCSAAAPDRSSLHFEAAALLDRAGRYDAAFTHVRLAHQDRRGEYDTAGNTHLTDGLIAFFTKSTFQVLPRAAISTRRPVFVVGMPRSGTSLVEQILASHPAVHGAGELPMLQRIACGFNNAPWAEGDPFPTCLHRLTVAHANQMAEQYLSAIAERNASADYVIDKLPVNFRELWLIQVLFPGARIIHCIRDPRDTCLSCYMTDFANGNEFARDLRYLGKFYRDYQRLMEHWVRVLDLPILHVRYEQVVEDVEGQARQMLEFLQLPWDERCLRFYENARHVSTASKDQVRRPIYGSSVGRWRNYQNHLLELTSELAGS